MPRQDFEDVYFRTDTLTLFVGITLSMDPSGEKICMSLKHQCVMKLIARTARNMPINCF